MTELQQTPAGADESWMAMRDRPKLAVVGGGRGPEREGALISAQHVSDALLAMEIPHELLDLADIDNIDFREYATAVLTTHGQYGEDGVLQGFLETLGVGYTGSGVLGSAIAMHKPTANLMAKSAGLLVPATVILSQLRAWPISLQRQIELVRTASFALPRAGEAVEF